MRPRSGAASASSRRRWRGCRACNTTHVIMRAPRPTPEALMDRYLGRYSEVTYALFRFVSGVLFACHGAQKLFGALGGPQMTSNPLMLVGGIIEFFGGLMIALGLFAGFAALVASGMMVVAYFMVHAKGGFWPIVNKGELAVVYCFLFLYIASRGSGAYSLEGALFRRGAPAPPMTRAKSRG